MISLHRGYMKRVAGGCHLNRNAEDLVRAAGFAIVDMEKKYIRGPKFLCVPLRLPHVPLRLPHVLLRLPRVPP